MIDIINEYVDIWNTRQTEKLQAVFSKSASYIDALQEGNAITVLSTSIEETAKAFPNVTFETRSIIQDLKDDVFVLEWLMKGTNKGSFFGAEPTNKEIKILGADIIYIKNEKIASIKSFYDSSLFATQLGL